MGKREQGEDTFVMQKHLEEEFKRVHIYTVIKWEVQSFAVSEAKEKGRIQGV